MCELSKILGYNYDIQYAIISMLNTEFFLIELYKQHQDPDNHNGYTLYEYRNFHYE